MAVMVAREVRGVVALTNVRAGVAGNLQPELAWGSPAGAGAYDGTSGGIGYGGFGGNGVTNLGGAGGGGGGGGYYGGGGGAGDGYNFNSYPGGGGGGGHRI